MYDRYAAIDSLALADQHIEQAPGVLARQQHAIDRLSRGGFDEGPARRLLSEMYRTLFEFEQHRKAIVQRIADLDALASETAR